MRPAEALLAGSHPGEQVIAAVHLELAVDIVQVGLDRPQRDEQLAGDVRIAFPLGHFQDDLALPVGDAIFCEERLREGIHPQRGSDRVSQEIDDQEDPIQGVGDGAEQEVVFTRERDGCPPQGRDQAGQGLQVSDRRKDHQTQQEVPSLRVPGTAQGSKAEQHRYCKGDEVPQDGDPEPNPKTDRARPGLQHGADG